MADDRDIEILEQGDIFFLYRPVVEEDEPEGFSDVQRFFVVLRPEGGRIARLIVLGRKRLPNIDRHERVWGFVSTVTKDERKLEEELREESYGTKTRGEQRQPAARPAGEGVYVITLNRGQMHLSYALELPDSPGPVQDALKLENEASFALSIKNPEKGQPANAGLSKDAKADYPDKLQEVFRDRRFAREDVRLLDYEGAEVLFVGARKDPQKAYGVELDTDDEDEKSADIFRKLRAAKSRHPVKPLLEGDWA